MLNDYKEPKRISKGEQEARDGTIILIILAVAIGFGYTVRWYTKLPTVHHSLSTGTCYKVVDSQGVKIPNGCKRLAGKYHMEYVP